MKKYYVTEYKWYDKNGLYNSNRIIYNSYKEALEHAVKNMKKVTAKCEENNIEYNVFAQKKNDDNQVVLIANNNTKYYKSKQIIAKHVIRLEAIPF